MLKDYVGGLAEEDDDIIFTIKLDGKEEVCVR